MTSWKDCKDNTSNDTVLAMCNMYLERNSLRVEAHVLQRASRLGYVEAGTAVTDERDERMDCKDNTSKDSFSQRELYK